VPIKVVEVGMKRKVKRDANRKERERERSNNDKITNSNCQSLLFVNSLRKQNGVDVSGLVTSILGKLMNASAFDGYLWIGP
jgi:hypothetical protein